MYIPPSRYLYRYLKVREELSKLCARPSKLDQGTFYFEKLSEVIGVIISFIDNLTWAGTPYFSKTIDKFRKIFQSYRQ